ncbi:unnamed protein product, partial [Medioppia subpectinata]
MQNTDPLITYEYCSEEAKAKIEAIKLMVRWLYGMKINTLIVLPENQHEVIASNTLKLLKTILSTGGDLNEQNLGGTSLERAHLRLAAALGILKIASNDAITSVSSNGDNTSNFQNPSTTLSIMSAEQWHSLATVLLDSEEFVREKFLIKLHKGLMSLALGLEFLAILSLGGTFNGEDTVAFKTKLRSRLTNEFLAILSLGGTFNGEDTVAFKTKLRSYLLLNLAKRRELIKSKSVANMKSIMPDCVMPYVIHLLAYMPFYIKYDDVSQLEIIKDCLWFIMEPLVLKNEHYSFSFFKKTFENIKVCVDRVSQSQEADPNFPTTNQMATMTNYKIYCGCDLALGLVMSKTQNFLLKDFPVQPSLPSKYFTVSASASDNNLKCYLPTEMQFAPPKRCGLEAEILGKITKSFPQSPSIPPPQRGRPSKASQQQMQQMKQQIVVITGENVIEEGTNSFYMIIKQLMERIAPIMVDHQGLLTLFNYVSDSLLNDGELDSEMGVDNSAKRGLQLIYSLSSVFPALFHGREIFTTYLLPFLWQSGDQHQVSELILQILTNIGASAGAEGGMDDSECVSIPWWAADDVIPRLVDRFVLKASTSKQAKYAIQCLNAIIGDENEKMRIFGEIIDQIKASGLSLETSPYFRSHLVTLGMIAICGGHSFFPKVLRSIIQKFIVQGLLMKDMKTEHEINALEESERQRENTDPLITYEYCSEEAKAKIEAIKLMVRWLYG